MKVGQVMSSSVVSVGPTDTLQQAALKMKDSNIGCLPVLDHGKLKGVITDRDIITCAVATGSDPSKKSVADCQSQPVWSVKDDSEVEEAVKVMEEHQVRRVPVVHDDKVVGIISLSDLARKKDLRDESEEALESICQPTSEPRRA